MTSDVLRLFGSIQVERGITIHAEGADLETESWRDAKASRRGGWRVDPGIQSCGADACACARGV